MYMLVVQPFVYNHGQKFGTNDKFFGKVAFLRYAEWLKFRSQIRERTSHQKTIEDWALVSHLHNGHVTQWS